MAAANRQGKMQNLINYRMRVTLQDNRQMTGQMLAFDKHMNLVLADTEEFRRTRRRAGKGVPGAALTETEERRAIGLTIIRGAQVVSLSVDGPPPADPAARMGGGASGTTTAAALAAGPGMSRPTGRGMPSGLTGPVPGAAGPGFFPPGNFGGPPPFAGRGGPPGGPPPFGGPPGGPPGGFGGPPGNFGGGPPGPGRGFPPGGFPGR
ncbi:Sm-like ribonucleoprotein [Polyplosphaeria fusca]|uniref:Sm protein B n=1 Tax=Polyplosphaeria fusca TaxID=682080 RepID=A0A9P4QWB0_9PLEO|nr:Sm-like ribonucleoprotein [Polyplosphaeria fusca]